jgi:protoporphyrin/coproporphyrin ferrochelatase
MSGSQSGPHTAILLLAHGSPDSVDQVPSFLLKITGGRPLPPEVVEEVQRRYDRIGRSPLTEITLKQGRLLAARLGKPVYVGMRNWHPFISAALQQIYDEGHREIIVICLAPQNSRTSVGLYRNSLKTADPALRFDFIDSWHDEPQLIAAFAEKLQLGRGEAVRETGGTLPVIFTAHSVPERTVLEGDPYEKQAKETAKLVADAASLRPADWRFAFQSQGMSGGKWLGPTVEETILALKDEGHTGVFVQPIGFLCDHVEVLYDVDVVFKQFAEEHGIRLFRADSLNDSSLLISALANLVNTRVAPEAR